MHKLIHMMAAIFTYVCPKCRQMQQFDRFPGIPKCPKCGIPMIKK
jgi:ribosomal protein L37AE/L43A